jgi:hypothetical protein
MFDGDEELFTVEPHFGNVYVTNFSYVPEKKEMFLLLESYGSRINFWKIAIDGSVDDQILTIDQETMYDLHYPYYISIKGQREIILYHIAQKKFTYAYFPCPIIYTSKKQDYYSDEQITIIAMMDLGQYYTNCNITFSFTPKETIYASIDLNYMDKENFPTDKFLKLVGTCSLDSKGSVYGKILLFENHIMTYSIDDNHNTAIKSRTLANDEIIFVDGYYDRGIMFYWKDTKRIFFQKEPINLHDKTTIKIAYESPDLIKRVVMKTEYYDKIFYIVDEVKYVKKCLLEKVNAANENGDSQLNIIFEYFVNRNFIGEYDFEVFKDNMLFTNGIGYPIQDRGKENELLDEGYENTICYNSKKNIVTAKAIIYKYDNKATVLPNFGNSVYPYTGSNYLIKHEYYFYSLSINEEFIIHIVEDNYGSLESGFDIVLYRSDGDYVLTKRFKIEDEFHTLQSINVSKDGRYLSILYNINDPDAPAPAENEEDNEGNKKKGRRDYYIPNVNTSLHVYELGFVRKRSTVKMIENYKNKLLHKDNTDNTDNADKADKADKATVKEKYKILSSEVMIDVKLVRKWENSSKYFGNYSHPFITNNLTHYSTSNEYVRADDDAEGDNVITVEYIYGDEYQNIKGGIQVGDKVMQTIRLFYEDKEVTKNVEGKLGTDENGTNYKTIDYEWIGLKNGFIGYRHDKVFYIRMKVVKELKDNMVVVTAKFKEVIQIDIILAKLDLSIAGVCECPDPNKILIALSNYPDNLFIVWGLSLNREIKNYSISGAYTVVQGHSSSTGYILSNHAFINLDN